MTATPGTAATASVGAPKAATPTSQVPDRPSQVDWADHEVFHFDPEIHRISAASSASSHPVGVQYGPARRSRRACAKMLVRAGHRCPTCFCLTSLCRCQRERVTFCLPSMRGNCIGHSHRAHALMSLPVSQAGEPSFYFRLAPPFFGNPRSFACNLGMAPRSTSYPHPCQWQVLHRSYSRRQRRLSLRRREHWSPTSELVQHAVHLFCSWFVPCRFSASMNPHRPGGGPRQHYRPDGSRRRSAGELAKRAARAAARAAAGPAWAPLRDRLPRLP